MATIDFEYPVTHNGMLIATIEGIADVNGRPEGLDINLHGIGPDYGDMVKCTSPLYDEIAAYLRRVYRDALDVAEDEEAKDILAHDKRQAELLRTAVDICRSAA